MNYKMLHEHHNGRGEGLDPVIVRTYIDRPIDLIAEI
jgi:hypothetical protein